MNQKPPPPVALLPAANKFIPVSVTYPVPKEEGRIIEMAEAHLKETRPTTARNTVNRGRRFIHWCFQQKLKWQDATPATVERFGREAWQNDSTRAVSLQSVETFLRTCSALGVPVARFPSREKAPMPSSTEESVNAEFPNLVHYDDGLAAEASAVPTSTPAPSPATVIAVTPPEAAPGTVPSAARRAAAAAPAAVPTRVAPARSLLPSGGAFVISRRATAADAAVAPLGAPIHIGRYFHQQIAPYGTMENFLDRCIAPQYVKPGGPSVVFVVDHEDDRGNKIRVGTEYPYDAPAGVGSGAGPLAGYPPTTYPFPPPSAPSDPRMAAVEAEAQRYQKLMELALAKLTPRDGAPEDPTLKATRDILELQHARLRGDLDRLGESLERERRERLEREERERREREVAAQLASTPSTGLGEITGAVQTPRPDAVVEALVKLSERVATPPPAPPLPPAVDPLAMLQSVASLLQTLTPKPTGVDPIVQRVLDDQKDMLREMKETAREAREARDRQSSRFGELGEAIKAVKEVVGLGTAITGGSQQESVWPAIVDAIAPHSDKLGVGLHAVLSGLSRQPAPIVVQGAPVQEKVAAQAAAAPQEVPPMPPRMAQLLRAMGTAQPGPEGDNEIIVHLGNLISLFVKDPKLEQIGKGILNALRRVNSKPELRALVTNLSKLANDATLLSDALIDRTTSAIHRNYSELFAQITGGEKKVLPDAEEEEEEEGEGEGEGEGEDEAGGEGKKEGDKGEEEAVQ